MTEDGIITNITMDRRQKTVPLAELYPIIAEVLDGGGQFTITITGNSMSPFVYEYRDQAVFAAVEGRRIRRGDIVFYQRDSGQFVMHRVYDVGPDGVMSIAGDAQWTLETGVRPDQLRAFVVRVVRKGKEVSCEKGMWHRLMTLYLVRFRHPRMVRLGLRALHALRAVIRRIGKGR